MAIGTRWTAAENALKGNLSSTSSAGATSVSTGIMGTDIGISIDLGGTRVLWLFGDSPWAASAGVTRSGAKWLRNCVMLQTGTYDLSTATMSHYCGGAPSTPISFFNPIGLHGEAYGKYPLGGVVLDEVLLTIGMCTRSKTTAPNNFGTTMCGGWATLFTSFDSGGADTWPRWEGIWGDSHDSFHVEQQWCPAANPIDAGDGYVYFPCFGPSQSGNWAICRADRALAKKGDLRALYWWDGDSKWIRDRPDKKVKYRANILGFGPVVLADQLGGIHKRPDGQFQLTMIPQVFEDRNPTVNYALAPSLASKYVMEQDPLYTPSLATKEFVYGAYSLPEQTFSGKGSTDQVINYSRNKNDVTVLTDATTYWPEFLQVRERIVVLPGSINRNGLTQPAQVLSAPLAQDTLANDGRTFLELQNIAGGSRTLSIGSLPSFDSVPTPKKVITIAAGATVLSGPFPTGVYGYLLSLDFSGAAGDVKMRAYSAPLGPIQ